MEETIVQVTNAEKVFWASIVKDVSGVVFYDFLVLLPDSAPYSYKEYQTQIEREGCNFGSVLVWYNKTTETYKLLKEGHIFYSANCTSNRIEDSIALKRSNFYYFSIR